MAKNTIAYLELSFLVHATEDPNKVLNAAKNLLPEDKVNQVLFRKDNIKGEYGNPITFYKTQIRDPQLIEELLKNIAINLSSIDKHTLLSEFEKRLIKGNLYIRLDKQATFRSIYKLYSVDPMHLRVKFKTSKIEDIKQICQEIGLLL